KSNQFECPAVGAVYESTMVWLPCMGARDEVEEHSKQIDREIKQWIKSYNQAIKLLLLGTGESGKTTIIKQMKILHVQGFCASERAEKANLIRHNIHESIHDIEYFDHVRTLWRDGGVRECFRRSNEYQLIDSAEYFLDRIDLIEKPDYIPSDADIL
ncbi:hypothetical protein SFRURICE_002081, partial [Spodoptera frugiperda]